MSKLDDIFAEVRLDGSMPAVSSASLSPISSEIIDFPLVTLFAPAFSQISTMIRPRPPLLGVVHMAAASCDLRS